MPSTRAAERACQHGTIASRPRSRQPAHNSSTPPTCTSSTACASASDSSAWRSTWRSASATSRVGAGGNGDAGRTPVRERTGARPAGRRGAVIKVTGHASHVRAPETGRVTQPSTVPPGIPAGRRRAGRRRQVHNRGPSAAREPRLGQRLIQRFSPHTYADLRIRADHDTLWDLDGENRGYALSHQHLGDNTMTHFSSGPVATR